MALPREDITTSIDVDTARILRMIASQRGQSLEDLIAITLKALAHAPENAAIRETVMAAYQDSHARYASLYERLAK